MHGRNKSENLQPKMMMPGYVRAERVKCGKPNCKCAKGELHGPYFYHFIWAYGRRLKRYVKAGDVKAVRAACEEYQLYRMAVRDSREGVRFAIKMLRKLHQ